MSKAKETFQPQNFKEVVMPFSQSVYMTVVVLNGDTVSARDREGCCRGGGGRINFLTDVPKTISSLRDIQGLQMDVPTYRLCMCMCVCMCVYVRVFVRMCVHVRVFVCMGGGVLPPSLKTLFLFLTQPEIS
jgi:hypothetical protein